MAATTQAAAGCMNHEADQRRRVYSMLDAADPVRRRPRPPPGHAVVPSGAGDHMRDARRLLRDALVCNQHQPTVYRAWIAMEERTGNAAAARPLFEGWRAWYDRDRDGGGQKLDEEEDEGAFWCLCIAFELRHVGAKAAWAVAEHAVVACPRDPAVYARYATAEMRLGRPDRAGDVLGRARDALDAGAWECLMGEVARYKSSMRKGSSWRRLRGLPLCRPGGGGRLPRPAARGYQQLGVA